MLDAALNIELMMYENQMQTTHQMELPAGCVAVSEPDLDNALASPDVEHFGEMDPDSYSSNIYVERELRRRP